MKITKSYPDKIVALVHEQYKAIARNETFYYVKHSFDRVMRLAVAVFLATGTLFSLILLATGKELLEPEILKGAQILIFFDVLLAVFFCVLMLFKGFATGFRRFITALKMVFNRNATDEQILEYYSGIERTYSGQKLLDITNVSFEPEKNVIYIPDTGIYVFQSGLAVLSFNELEKSNIENLPYQKVARTIKYLERDKENNKTHFENGLLYEEWPTGKIMTLWSDGSYGQNSREAVKYANDSLNKLWKYSIEGDWLLQQNSENI